MPFSNPIVGGDALIRPAIHSPDYSAGVTGWSINRDGTAEFNDATFRGPVSVITPDGTVKVFEDPSGHPAVEFFDTSDTLEGGMIYDPASDAIFMFSQGVGVYMDQVGMFLENAAGSWGLRFDEFDTNLYQGTRTQNYGWQTIAWAGGWSTRPGFDPLQYKLCPDGTVQVRGGGSGGTSASGTVIGTIPSQIVLGGKFIRPQKPALCNLVAAPGANGANSPAVQFNTNGAIQIFDCSGATTISLHTFYSISS